MFVTIEGIDGAGKTTQAEMLRNFALGLAQSMHLSGGVVLTNEPNDGRLAGAHYNPSATTLKDMTLGQIVRSLIGTRVVGDIDLTTRLLLIYAARRKHISEVVAPAIKKGGIVICDRFYDSSIAYFGYDPKVGFERAKQIVDTLHLVSLSDLQGALGLGNALDAGALPVMPDITFWIDTPPTTSSMRMYQRDFFDEIDDASCESSVAIRSIFQQLAKTYPDRIVRIDGNRTPEEVHVDMSRQLEAAIVNKYSEKQESLALASS